MSGTSLDGVDAAIIRSDGHSIQQFGEAITLPYDEEIRRRLRVSAYGHGDVSIAMRDMTLAHVDTVHALLYKANLLPEDVDLIGFHGQSIDHRPAHGITLQIGDPSLLAEKTGIDVVSDFRRRDVAAGGQGAPLVPLYHAALVSEMPKPVAILNIGGIANVTWVGQDGILAYDTGPGNVLLNEWMGKRTGIHIDTNGTMAQSGQIQNEVIETYLQDPFFNKKPPKSIDRNYFHIGLVRHLSTEDGAATLAAFTARSIARAQDHFPEPVKCWVVAGGGRHNPVLMKHLHAQLNNVKTAEEVGWDGDALEAQAFAFLAIRSYLGLHLSLPTTTGVSRPVTGGALWRGKNAPPS